MLLLYILLLLLLLKVSLLLLLLLLLKLKELLEGLLLLTRLLRYLLLWGQCPLLHWLLLLHRLRSRLLLHLLQQLLNNVSVWVGRSAAIIAVVRGHGVANLYLRLLMLKLLLLRLLALGLKHQLLKYIRLWLLLWLLGRGRSLIDLGHKLLKRVLRSPFGILFFPAQHILFSQHRQQL